MKIAFINIYQTLVARGSETFVKELSNRLSQYNKVDIISQDKKVPERWPIIWKLFLDPQGLLVFWFTIRNIPRIWKENYDIIVPLNGGWQVAVIRILTWLKGSKMVVAGQSGIGWDDKNNLWSFPNAFIALSSKALSWAKKAMPFVKSFYIPNGVDLEHFNPKGEKLETSLTKPIILCVGAFTEQKRIDLVIKAVAKIKEVSLLVVGGGGPLKEKLASEGKNLLGNRFEITTVSFTEMPKVYRSADIFTLPSSSSESFGNVLVEAMASGLPVVATNDPVRYEIVGDAGILVDPMNTNEYSEALQNALDTNWGNKPRMQSEKFSWDEVAKKYEKLFRELVKEK